MDNILRENFTRNPKKSWEVIEINTIDGRIYIGDCFNFAGVLYTKENPNSFQECLPPKIEYPYVQTEIHFTPQTIINFGEQVEEMDKSRPGFRYISTEDIKNNYTSAVSRYYLLNSLIKYCDYIHNSNISETVITSCISNLEMAQYLLSVGFKQSEVVRGIEFGPENGVYLDHSDISSRIQAVDKMKQNLQLLMLKYPNLIKLDINQSNIIPQSNFIQ